MIQINNKFEIGEEVFTVVKKPNSNCISVTIVIITDIISKTFITTDEQNINKCKCTNIKYKVKPINQLRDMVPNIRNRSEATLFKTLEEAEQYCKKCNAMNFKRGIKNE